jgi:glycogen debranching enzyme
MDAKVGDIAITPRAGRAVEIQALWYNALKTMEEFAREFNDLASADRYAAVAASLKEKFAAIFWNEDTQCLFDVVGGSSSDASIRPNQVIAISLRHCLIEDEQARAVLAVAEQELLTPYGLRTLSPLDPSYRGKYEGDVWGRDSAYHQGTVWPWLIGPYFRAKLKFAEGSPAAVEEARAWLQSFSAHFSEAGLSQVSEIFDGDAPHQPRGCIAHAWSVSELLWLAKLVEQLTPASGGKSARTRAK